MNFGLKKKNFQIFFSKFSLEGPPGASKVFSKNSAMGSLGDKMENLDFGPETSDLGSLI